MKKLFQYSGHLLLTGALVTLLHTGADAQRGFHGGGGFRSGFGGGFRGGFGGSIHLGGYGGGYRVLGYPRIGFSIGVLPFGYYPFFIGANQYYYADGIFYRPYGDGNYQVVTPPVGAEIPKLPSNASSIVIDGQQYYEVNGVYYKPRQTNDGKTVYVVAGKDGVLDTTVNNDNMSNNAGNMLRLGDIVDELPADCSKIKLNGKTYFVSPEGIHFEEIKDDNNNTAYRVVGLPDEDDNSEQPSN
ncbi:hypothetical protein HH214_02960 [Mucilaginibacter robiniae]|uniref:Uncharacterized protein n=1 Tax=Mucilaginibacter robiniae TaxID=2728022 RepID=A0A7L5DWB4_9SPHI|nr:DUF6515 family protein [Mucilaginibacter robiniae]QJD94357.1 hypothetical protein HH214_02960 [Mucilaginibacter robiniae]